MAKHYEHNAQESIPQATTILEQRILGLSSQSKVLYLCKFKAAKDDVLLVLAIASGYIFIFLVSNAWLFDNTLFSNHIHLRIFFVTLTEIILWKSQFFCIILLGFLSFILKVKLIPNLSPATASTLECFEISFTKLFCWIQTQSPTLSPDIHKMLTNFQPKHDQESICQCIHCSQLKPVEKKIFFSVELQPKSLSFKSFDQDLPQSLVHSTLWLFIAVHSHGIPQRM